MSRPHAHPRTRASGASASGVRHPLQPAASTSWCRSRCARARQRNDQHVPVARRPSSRRARWPHRRVLPGGRVADRASRERREPSRWRTAVGCNGCGVRGTETLCAQREPMITRCRQEPVEETPSARDRNVAATVMGSRPGSSDVIEILASFTWPAATQCLPVLTMSLNHPGQYEEIFAAIRVMQLSSAHGAEDTEYELLDEGHLEEPVLRRASTSSQCGTLDGTTSAEARPLVFRIRAQVRATCWRAGPDCDLAQLPIRPIPPMEYALSACWVRSNPLDSFSGLTRRPMVRSMALASNQVTVNEKTTVTTAARNSRHRRWKPPPLKRPFAPARLTVRVANNPRRTMPINPPTPWTPRTSRESS